MSILPLLKKSLFRLFMEAHMTNPSTGEVEAVGSLKFQASQGYVVRPCLKNSHHHDL